MVIVASVAAGVAVVVIAAIVGVVYWRRRKSPFSRTIDEDPYCDILETAQGGRAQRYCLTVCRFMIASHLRTVKLRHI